MWYSKLMGEVKSTLSMERTRVPIHCYLHNKNKESDNKNCLFVHFFLLGFLSSANIFYSDFTLKKAQRLLKQVDNSKKNIL